MIKLSIVNRTFSYFINIIVTVGVLTALLEFDFFIITYLYIFVFYFNS